MSRKEKKLPKSSNGVRSPGNIWAACLVLLVRLDESQVVNKRVHIIRGFKTRKQDPRLHFALPMGMLSR